MNRRKFLTSGIAAGASVAFMLNPVSAAMSPEGKTEGKSNMKKFKLKYAPHFGMFRHHAGNDLIDQLKFAADQGFTAWEDNGMAGKSKDLQEKVAREMSRLGMTMGVFVAAAHFGKKTFVHNDLEIRKIHSGRNKQIG